jgi:hypothetical protein
MDNSVIRFPIKCPCCNRESLVSSSRDTILDALATGRRLVLSANCVHHQVSWVANKVERHQIREYTAALRVSMRGKRAPVAAESVATESV